MIKFGLAAVVIGCFIVWYFAARRPAPIQIRHADGITKVAVGRR